MRHPIFIAPLALLLAFALSSSVAGCRKRKPAASPVPEPAPAADGTPATQANAAAPAPVPAPPPPPPQSDSSNPYEREALTETSSIMGDLNSDLRTFRGQKGRLPNSIEELTQTYKIKLPPLPPGKRLVIDKAKERIVLQ